MSFTHRVAERFLEGAGEAFTWYEEQKANLGERFLQTLRITVEEVHASPKLHPTIFQTYRRVFLRPFPYFLYYRLQGSEVEVVLLHHCVRSDRGLRRVLRSEGL